jgi:hypothetical protein
VNASLPSFSLAPTAINPAEFYPIYREIYIDTIYRALLNPIAGVKATLTPFRLAEGYSRVAWLTVLPF